jgi:hypothetical protein
MAKVDMQAWLKRADQILIMQRAAHYGAAGEVHQFTISMLSTLYGAESPQLRAY